MKKIGPCTPEEEGGRKTTAGVLEGFAPGSLYGGGGKRPLSQYTRRNRGGAKRPRAYSKASPRVRVRGRR